MIHLSFASRQPDPVSDTDAYSDTESDTETVTDIERDQAEPIATRPELHSLNTSIGQLACHV